MIVRRSRSKNNEMDSKTNKHGYRGKFVKTRFELKRNYAVMRLNQRAAWFGAFNALWYTR